MEKDRTLARILSFITPGFGQIYVGRLQRGIIIFVCTIIGFCAFFLPGFIIWIWQIIDAGKCADEVNSSK